MEFLLLNHPLDCPICDQGGECDLQDQAMSFGSDRGRFTEAKRGVADKNLGPLIKTVMSRCIHCTRCVRFAKEIAGIEDMGVTGRGRDAEIGTYVERVLVSELSGNVIDLCPVGALTSKPGAFTFRPWEVAATESVDVSDALGSNVRVDSRGSEVLRVTPRLNDDVNEEWISDKARFQYDALRYQRLATPLLRGPDGRLREASWREALAAAAAALASAPAASVRAIAGKLADAESIVALKDLVNALGSGDHSVDGGYADLSADLRAGWTFASTIAGLSKADKIFLVGTNLRKEAPVLNARIRAQAIAGVPVALLGEDVDLTYPKAHVGVTGADLVAKADEIAAWLAEAKAPVVVVGTSVLAAPDRAVLLAALARVADKAGLSSPDHQGVSFLHESASRGAALDLGFVKSPDARKPDAPEPAVVYLLGADDFAAADVPESAFVIYQGHTGDAGAARADVVLPGAAYTEKAGTYVNTEGRAQRGRRAVPPPGDARDDWKIVRALAEVAGVTLPYDTIQGVQKRLAEVSPTFAKVDAVQTPLPLFGLAAEADRIGNPDAPAQAADAPLASRIENFYQTDALSRASKTLARQTKAVQKPFAGRDTA